MATASEIKQRIELETRQRERLAVPAIAGGVLYLLSAIVLNAALKGLPSVGALQGLAPALRGEAKPTVSPRAAEVKFLDHHAFGVIAGSVLSAIAVAALTLVLLFIVRSTTFRRPESWPPTRVLVLIGGIAVPVLNVLHEIVVVIEAHRFATGSDFSSKAVDEALLNTGSGGILLGVLALLAAIALTVGMIAVMMSSMRAGLLPRWLSVLGIISGLLFLPFFGAPTLQLILTFWMVSTGILLMGRLPSGDPPAWTTGESRPWPTQAELREQREQQEGKTAKADTPAPAPAPVASGGSRGKRRKRR